MDATEAEQDTAATAAADADTPTPDDTAATPDDTTGDGWVGPQEAAATQGVSVRTIERRARDGRLHRRYRHGRPEIWMGEGDPPATRRVAGDIPSDTPVGPGDTMTALVPEATATTTLATFADRIATVAEADARRSRLSARVAWAAAAVLAHAGLRPDELVGADAVPRPKPAPDMVLEGCRRFGLRTDQAVMVGDSRFDQQAAAAAEVAFIGYRRGEGSLAELLELPARLGLAD